MSLVEVVIPEVKEDQGFWFIRTNGGKTFDSFSEEGVIGISYPKIKLSSLLDEKKKLKGDEEITSIVEKKYEDHQRPGLITSHIVRFFNEIKVGDYVFIPSKQTQLLRIGIVQKGQVKEEKIQVGKNNSQIYLLRKVKWLKLVQRVTLNPSILSIVYSHQTICDASEYASDFLNGLYDFYKFGDNYNIVLKVKKESDISILDFSNLIGNTLESVKEFTDSTSDQMKEVSLKTNINSPGLISWVTENQNFALSIFGMFVLILCGGKLEVGKFKIGVDASLLRQLSDFLDRRQQRKARDVMIQSAKNLQIEDLNQLKPLISGRDDKNLGDEEE